MNQAGIEMSFKIAIQDYIELGEYWGPDYERPNIILSRFKEKTPQLSRSQTLELVAILKYSNDWKEKFFVTDLLYLYDSFDIDLLEPLLECAIAFPDPSINRIFLRPGLRVFGLKQVSDILSEKFLSGEIIEKIRISGLVYWLRGHDDSECQRLVNLISERAKKTDNIVELYHYNLLLTNQLKAKNPIPNNAVDLINAIRGNRDLENILYNLLGWTKANPSYQ